ncbi:MAG: hypothetical protein WCX31_21425 [Salinivirgaceae bacterium]
MMPMRTIWCPNVILLDPFNLPKFPVNEIGEILKKFSKDTNLLYVKIGDLTNEIVNAQIILKQEEYLIYKKNNKAGNTLFEKELDFHLPYLYYIHTQPDNIRLAFIHFIDILGFDYPVIVEAPSLAKHLAPAAIFIPDSEYLLSDVSTNLLNLPNTEYYTANRLSGKQITYSHQSVVIG